MFNWSILAHSEDSCCTGDYFVTLEHLGSQEVLASSGSKYGLYYDNGETAVHGHTVQALENGAELVLRNRSGRTMLLSTIDNGSGLSYCASITIVRAG